MFVHSDLIGDELHLRQILINILGNSVKFTLVKLILTGEELFHMLKNGRTVEKDSKYEVIISAVDYDAEVYSNGEDTGTIIKDTYLEFMTDKTLIAPEKQCR